MVWKRLVIDSCNFGPFCRKPSKKLILQVNLKETLGNGFAMTDHAGYIKVMFKALDFYSAIIYVTVNMKN